MNVFCLIPAYNEEDHIASVILRCKPYADQIVVCDDGSKDLTASIAKSMGSTVITHDKNQGKGAALKTLFQFAKDKGADVVVTVDGDGQHNPEEIPMLIEPIKDGKADVVNGARYVPNYRRYGNKVLNRLTNVHGIKDSQSGFRAYSKSALEKIVFTTNGFGVDSSIMSNASQQGLILLEKPISVEYEDNTPTRHPVRHTADVFLTVFYNLIDRGPLRYMSLPGIILAVVGLGLGLGLVNDFLTTPLHYFSLPLSLLAIMFLVVGIVLFITGLILHAINRVVDRVDRKSLPQT